MPPAPEPLVIRVLSRDPVLRDECGQLARAYEEASLEGTPFFHTAPGPVVWASAFEDRPLEPGGQPWILWAPHDLFRTCLLWGAQDVMGPGWTWEELVWRAARLRPAQPGPTSWPPDNYPKDPLPRLLWAAFHPRGSHRGSAPAELSTSELCSYLFGADGPGERNRFYALVHRLRRQQGWVLTKAEAGTWRLEAPFLAKAPGPC